VVAGTRRLFIAIPVPEEVRAALAAALEPVRARFRGGRWQSPDTWHLTLRFLGDTPVGDLPLIERAVRGAAAAGSPFRVALGEAGSFEHRRGGRVAWVGLAQGGPEAAALAGRLAAALAPGEPAGPPPQIHLTIARDAPDGLVPAMTAAVEAVRAGTSGAAGAGRVGLGSRPAAPARGEGSLGWVADRLVLYHSVLGRGGATHTALLEAPLGG
jgi:2'-5' RNA ligase